ncbi:hypothetical protein GX50_03893 [[Emmonsia] crescens]|uniref:Uncharacterized protein n=1 Tax=[Emmonsia] crescens TaxID=73230 RepID=A0A2B7ZJV4_9EURO|nr:hypothetical protein GX50_03893 [Emmonsia crescens]
MGHDGPSDTCPKPYDDDICAREPDSHIQFFESLAYQIEPPNPGHHGSLYYRHSKSHLPLAMNEWDCENCVSEVSPALFDILH